MTSTLEAVKRPFIEAFENSGLTQAELSSRLGVYPMHVARLLDITHSSDLERPRRRRQGAGVQVSHGAKGEKVHVLASAAGRCLGKNLTKPGLTFLCTW